MSEFYIAHHGVLGMKWGVRRYQPYGPGEKKGKEIGAAAKVKTERDRVRDMVGGDERRAISDYRSSNERWANKEMKKEMQKAVSKNIGRGTIEYIKHSVVGTVLGVVSAISRAIGIRGGVKAGASTYQNTKKDFSEIQSNYKTGKAEVARIVKERGKELDKELKASNESENAAMKEYDRLIKSGVDKEEAELLISEVYEDEMKKRGYEGL